MSTFDFLVDEPLSGVGIERAATTPVGQHSDDTPAQSPFPVDASPVAPVAEHDSPAIAQLPAGGGDALCGQEKKKNITGNTEKNTENASLPTSESITQKTESESAQTTVSGMPITKTKFTKSSSGFEQLESDGSKNISQAEGAPPAESATTCALTSTILEEKADASVICVPPQWKGLEQKSPSVLSCAPTATGNDIGAILDQVADFLRKYIVFTIPEHFDLVSLWVAHTYVYELFHFTPYLIIRSPEAECGKSTVLSSLKLLTHAPWKVVVPTPAVIYRKIERDRPTLLIDEFDTIYSEKIKSEANETLRGTLNAGFERGDVIPRCDGPKNELLEFSPYCPKALAGIGRLPETVESRAFIIPIVRLGHSEHVQEYDEEIAPEEARPIAEALKTWALSAAGPLKKANPSRPTELKPRQRNIAKPLLAIADLAGGDWPDRGRDAIVRTCAKEKLISQAAQLLADIRAIMQTGNFDKITTEMLLEYLVRVENANSPWPVLWENDLKNGKTRGPAKKLASLLSAFDVHPRALRFGADVKKGYVRADFVDVWDRYLEPAAPAETAELDLEL